MSTFVLSMGRIVSAYFDVIIDLIAQCYRRIASTANPAVAPPEFYYVTASNRDNNNGGTELIFMPRVLTTSTTALAGSFVDLTSLENPTEDPYHVIIFDDVF